MLGFAGEDGLVVRGCDGESRTGFALFFRMGVSLRALCAGFEEFEDRLSSCFECLYHAPIEWACAQGIDEIDYEIGSVTAKAERGRAIFPVSTWWRPGATAGGRTH
ncbi:hypothetical protein KGQ20_17000 [Catenulispora sp. NF23]|uniref:hypothetical protein n=1 Tax=Catenulispora pinistramenti TaxID=2705254 RepID=UPI001BAA5FAC|nr:hypothetical protein [Catenulispora pinistramenti]MBS2534472.1 hypothetical protein [Catenulispora pinistramenti]